MVNGETFLPKSTYAIPVYILDFINTDEGENIELNISGTMFLDSLLCQLNGAIIDSSEKLKGGTSGRNIFHCKVTS